MGNDREKYASYDQYTHLLRKLINLQLTLEEMKTLIALDTEDYYAEEIVMELNALDKKHKVSADILEKALELRDSTKTRLTRHIGWLGRRRCHELKCLCEFGMSFSGRDTFLYENVVQTLINDIDNFEPDSTISAVDISENYAISVMLVEVVQLIDLGHKVNRNYIRQRNQS